MPNSDLSIPPGTFSGGWSIRTDASGNLGFYYNGAEQYSFSSDTGGSGAISSVGAGVGTSIVFDDDGPAVDLKPGGTVFRFVPSGVQSFAGITCAGLGLPAEYASTGPAGQVALQTTSTNILSYTPTVNALFLVLANFTHQSATVAGTATLTYKDVGIAATATQSYTIASAASGVSVSTMFLCCAVSGTAIALVGTSATNNDILASCAIFQL